MEDILLQALNQSGKLFKIITFPDKMPKDIFKNKKFLIGIDPKIFTEVNNRFFKKSNFKFKPLTKNLIDKIWEKKKLRKK